ncbi:MAG: hypothetical protein EPO16_12260 [Dehalococcoidia bacterium]|nr:MAG: hypothetical protein EPO16_12260 [Dehalococcoidia bacterium]
MAGEIRPGLLDHLLVRGPDVTALKAFYRDVLGGVVVEEALPHWARVRVANIDVGLHAGEPGGGAQPRFRVQSVAMFRAHLQSHGVAIPEGYHAIPGGVELDFADPAGNLLGVVQYGVTLADLA